MLAKIINKLRNGYMAYHLKVSFREVRFCTEVLDLLWKENLIKGYARSGAGSIKVFLMYYEGNPACTRLTVLSRPRDRFYVSLLDLSRSPDNYGVLILSTSMGIMTSKEAIKQGLGGETLAYAS